MAFGAGGRGASINLFPTVSSLGKIGAKTVDLSGVGFDQLLVSKGNDLGSQVIPLEPVTPGSLYPIASVHSISTNTGNFYRTDDHETVELVHKIKGKPEMTFSFTCIMSMVSADEFTALAVELD